MRESERVSGRIAGETAKCPLVRRVSDLGHTANTGAHGKTSVRRVSWIWAHDKFFFIFNFKSVYGKKYGKEVLCHVPYPWHTANLLSFHPNLETCFTKINEMYVAKDYQIN